ncbi:MAG: hypothetical protein QM765_38180 [Myxococcales bacterium]
MPALRLLVCGAILAACVPGLTTPAGLGDSCGPTRGCEEGLTCRSGLCAGIGWDAGQPFDGDAGATGACSTPPRVEGVLHTSIADIDYTGAAIVELIVNHKMDVDVLEDRCVAYLYLHLALENPKGCELKMYFDPDGLSSVILQADSRCPGFPDAREGAYYSLGFAPSAWFSGLDQVEPRQAEKACTRGVTLTLPSGSFHAGTLGVKSILTMDLGGLSLVGDIESKGDTSVPCHKSRTCAEAQSHDSGDPGWCNVSTLCSYGYEWTGSKCCPEGTSC